MNFYLSDTPIPQSQINLLNCDKLRINSSTINLDLPWLDCCSITETVFDYVPNSDVPPCVNFLDQPTKDIVLVLSLPVELVHSFGITSQAISLAYDLKFDHFNGMPKTFLNELELAWIGIEQGKDFIIINNNQINGAFFPFLSRRQVRDIHRFLIKLVEQQFPKTKILIPHHSLLRKFVERMSDHPNRSIKETPYSSQVVKGYTKTILDIQTRANDFVSKEESLWWVKNLANS